MEVQRQAEDHLHDLKKAKKTKVAEHKDINDKGQTVRIVKPGTPTKSSGPKTGDNAKLVIWAFAFLAAAGMMGTLLRRRVRKAKE